MKSIILKKNKNNVIINFVLYSNACIYKYVYVFFKHIKELKYLNKQK